MNNEVVEMKINEHDRQICSLTKRMNLAEQSQAEFRIEIKNLCSNIKGLTAAIKWFIFLMVGSFVSFFFYAIQQGLFS
ncbi:MAG: hemolysin XhlA family protein [Clostridia bacterium]|nr:hemolysin XhlA family protein [Clostridia bacterium]